MLEQQNSASSELINTANEAIQATKKIDSYYLVPCKKPELMTKENEELKQALNHIDYFLIDAIDCYKRHNGLIPQLK